MTNKCKAYLVAAAIPIVLLSGCGEIQAVTGAAASAQTAAIEETHPETLLTMQVTPENVGELDKYSSLKTLIITGSDCYDEIEEYISRNGSVDVCYEIAVADEVFHNTDTTLKCSDKTDIEALCSLAGYFRQVSDIDFSGRVLTVNELELIRNAFAGVGITYLVEFNGETYPSDTEELDLSSASGSIAAELAKDISSSFPKLKRIELIDTDGECSWSPEEMITLSKGLNCDVSIDCRFELFGQTVSSDMEEIQYRKIGISDSDLELVRDVLPLLASCKRFVLDYCGPSYKALAELRDEFPDKGIVWRVNFGPDSLLTDAKVLWSTYVFDSNSFVLKYCNELEYIDIGHDEGITDISFVSYMPNLKVLIISLTDIDDISPLANCTELEYLEIFRTNVKDISPLAGLTKLEHLNMCNLEITDLSPLYGLKNLKRLWMMNLYWIKADNPQRTEIAEQLPDCEIVDFLNDGDLTGHGWRKDGYGNLVPRYELLKEQIGYNGYNSPKDKLDSDNFFKKEYASSTD